MDQKYFVFELCKIVHNPPRPPHGRIVDTRIGCPDDCGQGITVYTVDGAESLLEQLVRGNIITQETARRLLREIEMHGVPTLIVSDIQSLEYYMFMQSLYANGGHSRFWDGLLGTLYVPPRLSD